MELTLAQAREAQALLRRYLPVSRLVPAPSLSNNGSSVYLKLETDLPTGSFKPRGSIYALAMNQARRPIREVVACSTGNHGAAVAYAGQQAGLPVTIFLPENPNAVKRARIAALGAKIVEEGASDLAAASERATAYARKEGVYFLSDATDPILHAGPGTIALEIGEQLPSFDTIVIPMGDTALIRGIASVAKQLSPKARIIGVQAERAPSYYLSWKAGRAIETETCDTIADGLATRTPNEGNVRTIRELVDDVVLVTEDEMLAAIRHLALEEHVIAEPAGAATTAALLHKKFRRGAATVLLVTGANIVPEILRRAICGGVPR
jgi:threonine dehydratase